MIDITKLNIWILALMTFTFVQIHRVTRILELSSSFFVVGPDRIWYTVETLDGKTAVCVEQEKIRVFLDRNIMLTPIKAVHPDTCSAPHDWFGG